MRDVANFWLSPYPLWELLKALLSYFCFVVFLCFKCIMQNTLFCPSSSSAFVKWTLVHFTVAENLKEQQQPTCSPTVSTHRLKTAENCMLCRKNTQRPIVLVVILLPSVDYDWYCLLICIFPTVERTSSDYLYRGFQSGDSCWWWSFQRMQTPWSVSSRLPSVVVHPPPLLGLHYHPRNTPQPWGAAPRQSSSWAYQKFCQLLFFKE